MDADVLECTVITKINPFAVRSTFPPGNGFFMGGTNVIEQLNYYSDSEED